MHFYGAMTQGICFHRAELISRIEAFDVFRLAVGARTLHAMTLGSVAAFFVGLLGVLHFISVKLKRLERRKADPTEVVA
jgi:hypothetical protein